MKKLILLLIATLTLVSCRPENNTANEKTEITVSILPQKYFLERIAGDTLIINVMIPPGSSPATYEPTPSQLTDLSNSDLYLMMGYTGFELAWMEKIRSVNPKMKVIDLSKDVDLIRLAGGHSHSHEEGAHEDHDHAHQHGGVDPHFWMSPKNVKQICSNIYASLIEEYPSLKDYFTANFKEFLTELVDLDMEIEQELSELSSRAFYTYHPSLTYFARDYDLLQIPMELEGKTPSAGYMRFLVDKAEDLGIKVLFLQMQFDQHNAEVLAEEIGASIIQMNPLDPEWMDQMKFITEQLKTNLQ